MIAQRFRSWLLVTVLLCIASFGVAEREFGQLTFACVLAVCGWWFTERRGADASDWAGLPRWLANIILLGVLGGSALRIYHGAEPVTAFGTFLTSIIVLKLWEKRATADYGQILTLSVFLAIGAALTDNSLILGLVMAAILPVLVITVMLYQLSSAHVKSGAPTDPPLATRDRQTWHSLRRTAWVTLLFGGAIAFVVFLLIPRGIGMSALGAIGRPTLGRTTGFNDSVDLGTSGTISESQTQVLELRVHSDFNSTNLGGTGRAFYLRGAVMNQYDHGRWVRSPNAYPNAPIMLRNAEERVFGRYRQDSTDQFINQEITLWHADRETPLFSCWRPVDVFVEGAGELRTDLNEGRLSRVGDPGVIKYRVRSRPDPTTSITDGPRPNVAPVSSVITRHAWEVLRRGGIDPDPATRPVDSDAFAVRALESYLRGTFIYTLTPAPAPIREDPTEWFLTSERKGHCEYFASGLALMCRAIGVDARVVSGYLAYEYDATRNLYVVRQSNAHAWVEARIAPDIWRTYDGTPPAWIDEHHGPPKSLAARLWRLLDKADSTWNGSVVTFDESIRSRILGERLISAAWVRQGGLFAAIRDTEPDQAITAARWWLWRALLVAVLVAIGTGLVFFVRKLRRRRATRHSGWAFDPRTPEGIAYAKLIATLAARGWKKPEWQPLAAFAAEIAPPPRPGTSAQPALEALARHPAAALAAATLLAQSRFGGTAFRQTEFDEMIKVLRRSPMYTPSGL